MTVDNKVVVILGASSGIGAATAKLLAKNGAKLVLGARRIEKLNELVASLPKDAEIVTAATDVTEQDQVQKIIDLAIEKFGHIDVLYNNAGIMPQGNLADQEFDTWENMLNTNIMGVLNGIGTVLPIMRQQKYGQIITTDSVAGHVLYPGSAVYNGTKFAVRAIMEGLRQEEHDNGIRSTIVSPGAVSTELINTVGNSDIKNNLKGVFESDPTQGYSLSPDDVAEAVKYAIEQPQHVTISEVLIRPSKQEV